MRLRGLPKASKSSGFSQSCSDRTRSPICRHPAVETGMPGNVLLVLRHDKDLPKSAVRRPEKSVEWKMSRYARHR